MRLYMYACACVYFRTQSSIWSRFNVVGDEFTNLGNELGKNKNVMAYETYSGVMSMWSWILKSENRKSLNMTNVLYFPNNMT